MIRAESIEAGSYYVSDNGNVAFVLSVAPGLHRASDLWIRWRLRTPPGPWLDETFGAQWHPDFEIYWTAIAAPDDRCPADVGPRPGRLVWRTCGRHRSLVEVERGMEEAGDEPFTFAGLKA